MRHIENQPVFEPAGRVWFLGRIPLSGNWITEGSGSLPPVSTVGTVTVSFAMTEVTDAKVSISQIGSSGNYVGVISQVNEFRAMGLVPEPSTLVLGFAGLAGLDFVARLKKYRRALNSPEV